MKNKNEVTGNLLLGCTVLARAVGVPSGPAAIAPFAPLLCVFLLPFLVSRVVAVVGGLVTPGSRMLPHLLSPFRSVLLIAIGASAAPP
eukprot:COSAG05_NODE_544_length_8777_cov_13.472805_1_plen_88_part_00